jgi:HD-like signal output (HDOD) protein
MVRIGLSGHTDEFLALQSTKTTHQQLLKPCDPRVLENTIGKAIYLRGKVRNDSLNQLISKAESLPALPKLYQQITEVLQSDSSSLQEVGKLVAKDIAMPAKILQLVKSAFFGLARHIGSAEEAVTYLGYDVIRGLILTIKLFSELEHANKSGLNLEKVWDRSFLTSNVAKHIAKLAGLDEKNQDYAQMSGMLNDVGILFMAAYMPEEYSEVIEIETNSEQSTCNIEKRIFGCTHADVGGSLLGLWGLPDPLVDAVEYHPYPSNSSTKGIAPVTIVHIANHYCWQNMNPSYPFLLDHSYIAKLHLSENVEIWRQEVKEIFFRKESP